MEENKFEKKEWISRFFPPLECDEEIKQILKEQYKEDYEDLLRFLPTPPHLTTIRVNTNIIQTNQLLQKFKQLFEDKADLIQLNPFLKDVLQFPLRPPNNQLVQLESRVIVGIG